MARVGDVLSSMWGFSGQGQQLSASPRFIGFPRRKLSMVFLLLMLLVLMRSVGSSFLWFGVLRITTESLVRTVCQLSTFFCVYSIPKLLSPPLSALGCDFLHLLFLFSVICVYTGAGVTHVRAIEVGAIISSEAGVLWATVSHPP